jgi:iron complex outermembrane receptor protein
MDAKIFLMWAAIAVAMTATFPGSRSLGQDSSSSAVAPAGNPQANAESEQDVDAGNIDKLLDAADKDVGNLSQVNVSDHTGSSALDMQVNSVERHDTTVAKTPAAVYVITNEMIKRSGARNIPEALRYVPGLQVARINADSWAISIRGFNGQFSSKILVQIDGRAIFQPIKNGVYWDQQFVLLEDVERIEVVRGSGGATWGMNAVNGIINIITKSSKDTKGLYAEAGGGDQHQIFSGARVGGQQGDTTWRVWGTQNAQNHGFLSTGVTPGDGLSTGQGGYRVDWQADRDNLFTFQGDWLGGTAGGAGGISVDTKLDGANNLLRWTRTFSEDSDQTVQLYHDYVNRANVVSGRPNVTNINTFDFDYKYHLNLANTHDIVAGTGYRNYCTQADYWFTPQNYSFDIISYYIQDTITLQKDLLFTTVGCKFAHEKITSFEYQPSWKIVMTPNEKTSIWGSISRTVGLPSLLFLNNDRTTPFRIVGNPHLNSEDTMSYEIGLRRQSTEKFYWDIAVYFNRYNNMIDVAPPVGGEYIFQNLGEGDTYGFEWTGNYRVNDNWNLTGNYTLFRLTQTDMGALGYQYDFPRNMYNLRSGWDIGKNVFFDVGLRYVDKLMDMNEPSYFLGDVRLAWRPNKHLEASIVGQDLFAGHHPEILAPGLSMPTETVPGWYGMVSYRY